MRGASKPTWRALCLDMCCLSVGLYLTYLIYSFFRTGGDAQRYHAYALAFWAHQPIFHKFPQEYPPLSLLPFSLTLFSDTPGTYTGFFSACMGGLMCIGYLWMARAVSRRKAITYAVYLFIGATGTLLVRYDLLPALVTLAALVLAERRRYVWASVLLALGVLLKIYPFFLMPVVLAYQWRTSAREPTSQLDEGQNEERLQATARYTGPGRTLQSHAQSWKKRTLELRQRGLPVLRSLGMFAGIVGLGFGVPALLNVQGTLSVFQYDFQRPLEIESLPASLLWLGRHLGFPAHGQFSFGSSNLVGPLDSYLKVLSLVGLVAGSCVVYWCVLRGKLTLGSAFIAALAVVLASNKVLSTQYLIWILPPVAYGMGFDWLWLVIAVLTTLIYPFLHYSPQLIREAFLPTIALRNFLLLVATGLAIRNRPPAKAAPGAQAEAAPSSAVGSAV